MSSHSIPDGILIEAVKLYRGHNNNQTAAARYLGIARSTLQSRLKLAAQRNLLSGETATTAPTQGLGGTVQDRKIIALKDEVSRLNTALRQAHRDANTDEIIREMLGPIINTPIEPPAWLYAAAKREPHRPDPEVPVTIFSDLHAGEVVLKSATNGVNEYNMAIAEDRVERYFDKLIMLCRDRHTGNYPGIVLNALGDNVSGGIHDELKKTDEVEVIPATLKARDWMAAGIKRLADHFGHVYIPAACGNHGRLTHRPEFKKYHEKNWDYLIIKMLEAHFQDDKRIRFDLRPSNDVYYRVYNERYLACHGDMLGVKGGDGIIGSIGPISRGEVKQSGQSSAMGRPFDKIIIGHWHQRLWLPRAIVNNALKGFDEFAMKGLGAKPDRPTQALWFVHPRHGKTAHWDIHVSDSPEAVNDWVSVFDQAA